VENSKLYTVKEYADIIGFSAQYIYKQIEAGKLKKVIKNGLTYIEVNPDDYIVAKNPQQDNQQNFKQIDNKFVDYLSTEVERLNRIVETLQQQLIECKNEGISRVIELNERKDAQLTKYIEFLNNSTQQLIAQAIRPQEPPSATFNTAHLHEAEIIEDETATELMAHLKNLGYSKEDRKKILKNTQKALVKDSLRFQLKDERVYIFLGKYSYKDLF
jgi:hypothetical protein